MIESLPVEHIQHLHRIVPLPEAVVEVSRALKQTEIDEALGVVLELALPHALCLDPVLGAEGRGQQSDGQAAHEKGDKYKGSFLEVHPCINIDDLCLIISIVPRLEGEGGVGAVE